MFATTLQIGGYLPDLSGMPVGLFANIAWFILGLIASVFLYPMLTGRFGFVRTAVLKSVLKGNSTPGWVLAQVRNRYQLLPLHDAEDGEFWVEIDDEKHYVDDPLDKMHTLLGVPIGIWAYPHRPIGDAEIAAVGTEQERKVADGGGLDDSEQELLDEVREDVVVAEDRGDERVVRYVNPALADYSKLDSDQADTLQQWCERQVIGHQQETVGEQDRMVVYGNPYYAAGEAGVVDASQLGRALYHEQNSDTPRKAAKNAKEAERAFDRYEGVKKTVSLIAAFTMGALSPRIAGGGGGGGGGLPIQAMPMPDVAIMPIVIDAMTLGVF